MYMFLFLLHTDRKQPKKSPKLSKHHLHHQPHRSSWPALSLHKSFGKKKKTRAGSAVDGVPMNVLNFPQHLPTHFLEDVRREEERRQEEEAAAETNGDSIDALNKHKEIETEIESEPAPQTLTTLASATAITSASLVATNIGRAGASIYAATSIAPPNSDISADSVSSSDTGVIVVSKTDIPPNVLSGNADDEDAAEEDEAIKSEKRKESANLAQQSPRNIEPISHRQPNDKLRIITVNPIVVEHSSNISSNNQSQGGIYSRNSTSTPTFASSGGGGVIVATNDQRRMPKTVTSSGQTHGIERGYYEKTIFNKNGVFIENIRKIANIDDEPDEPDEVSPNKVILNAASSSVDNDSEDSIEAAAAESKKKIALMSVPLSQHYVITSSGRIEKSDALASDDVIAQFRDGLNDYQRPVYRQDGGRKQAENGSSNNRAESSVTFLAADSTAVTSEAPVMVSLAVTVVAEPIAASKQPPQCIVMGE